MIAPKQITLRETVKMADDRDSQRVFSTDPDGQTRITDRPSVDQEVSRPLQDMDFSTHILSLNAMALLHLGDVDGIAQEERDIEAAAHIIDTLAMLKAKTVNNLNASEEKLLDTLLYELKVKYLQVRG